MTLQSFYLLLFCLVSISAIGIPSLPQSGYGVWDRSYLPELEKDPSYDYLLGIQADISWDEVQPTPDKYDWSYLQSILEDAYARKKFVMFSINVGPDAPAWVYDQGVPKVSTNDQKHSWPYYPYYLDANYKKFYFEFIKQFAIFLCTQPTNLLQQVSFVQVKTGCTGDEIHYKGVPLQNQYVMPKEQWEVSA